MKRRCFAHSFCKAPWSFGRTVQEVKLSLSNSSGFTSVFAASSAPHSPAEGLLTTAHVRSLRMCLALRTGAHVFPEPHLEATMSEEFMMIWSQRLTVHTSAELRVKVLSCRVSASSHPSHIGFTTDCVWCFKVPTRLVGRDKLLQQPTLLLPQLFLQQYRRPDAARHKSEVQRLSEKVA